MNKKIIFGSLFVLALMLMMPSIPAIQQKTIEDRFNQEIQEKLESINLNDLEHIEKLDDIKYPILLLFVMIRYNLLFLRAFIVGCLSFGISYEYSWVPELYIKYPLLYEWFEWLADRSNNWINFWESISDSRGWNW